MKYCIIKILFQDSAEDQKRKRGTVVLGALFADS